MKLYIVRHGKDADGYRGGWSQRGLVAEGIEQANKLGEWLHKNKEHYLINTIISSDLARASETTQGITSTLNLDCIFNEEWREMNNGLLAGMANHEAELKFPDLYFNSLPMDEPYPNGESPRHFYNRICASFKNLCADIESGVISRNVLLVTHGGVINILYYYLNGLEWSNKSSFYPVAYTSLHTVEKVNDRWLISEQNNTIHLQTDDKHHKHQMEAFIKEKR